MWPFQNTKCIYLGGITLGWKMENSGKSQLFTFSFHYSDWVEVTLKTTVPKTAL